MISQEENITMIKDYLDKGEHTLLVLFITASGQLQPMLEFPSSKVNGLYFAKRLVFPIFILVYVIGCKSTEESLEVMLVTFEFNTWTLRPCCVIFFHKIYLKMASLEQVRLKYKHKAHTDIYKTALLCQI